MIDRTKFVSLAEIDAVLAWLHHRRRRGRNYQLNRAIFRLSCCCGMRCMEICGLDLRYVQLDEPPFIRIGDAVGM
jgi:integrase